MARNMRGVRHGRGGAMWAHLLGPQVEFSGGHQTCDGCAEMGAGAPCGRARWGHGWSALGSTKRVRGVPKLAQGRRVDAPDGAMGGAPWGDETFESVPKLARGRHVDAPAGAIGGAPWEARLGEGCTEKGAETPRGRTRRGH